MRISIALLPLVAALLIATHPIVVGAQSPSPVATPPGADTTISKPFDIPAQPLSQAIVALQAQAGIEIVVDGLDLGQVQSFAVSGTFTSAQALRRLLSQTGFAAHFRDERTAVLLPASATPQTLRAVEVVASRRAGYAASATSTATRTPTPLRDVPQSVSIITRALIQDLSMQGMADAVRFVPGVTMGQGEGNRDQPTIRGNNTTADFFVDGVRDDVQYFRDLYNVERIEALKGSNAMVFGRGGGGGVLNRVTKQADWSGSRELSLQAGSFDNKRASLDVGGGVSRVIAARLNGMYERSGVFRDAVTIERFGINPTITIAPTSGNTRLQLGYEHFDDRRTADRGIPSFEGRPVTTDVSTFFGDPDRSWADVRAHVATATITHEKDSALSVRSRLMFGAYDKFYQNIFPGAVNATGDQVSISAYNNDTHRQSLFNQTDVVLRAHTGVVRHTVLLGAELGRQVTDNRRLTGYFDNSTTSVMAPLGNPRISVPLTFRPSATDADNDVTNTSGAVYVQDQIALSPRWQLIGGARYERFDLRYHNDRTDSSLRRIDHLISPRAGLLFKPLETLSFYASHSVSFLPSAGDQFSSLTDVTKGLEPERFRNHEVGMKWDIADRLAVGVATYRLDRTNTRAPHPTDPTRTVQTGSQRTTGVELSLNGNVTSRWEIAWAYANQSALITRTTASAARGSTVPLVPRTSVALWNRYQVGQRIGLGLGVVHRSDMYAALDNRVTLPAYTDADAALYLRLGRNVRAQAFVENIFDTEYYATAHSNNNISPGSRRALRVSLMSGF